jgi:hypothetical protein
VPRPALLAEIVNAGAPGVAVAGTSGKSTVTGMIGWILREAGVAATVLGGAALVGEGVSGCFAAGPARGPVVAEACESDGTLVGYRPAVGVILNVSRDHDELDALRRQFAAFAGPGRTPLVNAASAEARALVPPPARTFAPPTPISRPESPAGPDGVATLRAGTRSWRSTCRARRPQPYNAAAAAAVALTSRRRAGNDRTRDRRFPAPPAASRSWAGRRAGSASSTTTRTTPRRSAPR